MNKEQENSAVFAGEASILKGKGMIAVISGGHGYGKTWFSLNLAHALSLLKQKVLLFDGDTGYYNSKSQLGLNNTKDLSSTIYGNSSLNQIVYTYDKGRFDIISGNSKTSGLSNMSIGRLQILGDDLDILAHNYNKILLDAGIGLTRYAGVLTGMAQSVIILCLDTPQSITESFELVKIIKSRYSKTKINIVINQVNTVTDGERAYMMLDRACRKFLDFSPNLLGIIRQDTRVRDSIRNQSTIISRYPQSEASVDIVVIAKRILENE